MSDLPPRKAKIAAAAVHHLECPGWYGNCWAVQRALVTKHGSDALTEYGTGCADANTRAVGVSQAQRSKHETIACSEADTLGKGPVDERVRFRLAREKAR